MNSEPVLVFVFAVVIIGLSLGLMVFIQGRILAKMKRLAGELGYEFRSGAKSASGLVVETDVPSFWTRLVTLLAPWRIEGMENGKRVGIFTITRGSGKSRSTYTVVEMTMSPSLPCDFSICKEGVLSKLGKALSLTKDIQIGDPEFDPKVLVKGSDSEAVQRLLGSSNLRRIIVEALAAYPSLEISSKAIRWERSGIASSLDLHKALIGTMLQIAKAL